MKIKKSKLREIIKEEAFDTLKEYNWNVDIKQLESKINDVSVLNTIKSTSQKIADKVGIDFDIVYAHALSLMDTKGMNAVKGYFKYLGGWFEGDEQKLPENATEHDKTLENMNLTDAEIGLLTAIYNKYSGGGPYAEKSNYQYIQPEYAKEVLEKYIADTNASDNGKMLANTILRKFQ